MTIKFDENLNNEIRRTVRNFNAKVKRYKTRTRGKGMLPQKLYVRELKAKYSDKTRAELNRQLKLYQSFGNKTAMDKATSESRLSKWEQDYFKQNLAKTREFYQNEIADLERIIGNNLGQHLRISERLINLRRKEDYLNKDLSTLDESEIKIMRNVYNYAERSDEIKAKSFRLYLSQLERTMENLGYSKSDIDTLLNKFNVLSENEFTELIRNEDLIDGVYDLIDSPKSRGDYELMTDEARARDIITDIQNSADEIIAKYKTS